MLSSASISATNSTYFPTVTKEDGHKYGRLIVIHSLSVISSLAYLFDSTAGYSNTFFTDSPPETASENQDITMLLFPGFK